MFTFPVFEILLSVGSLVLWVVQRGTWSRMVNISVATQNKIQNLLKLLGKWLNYQLRRFWIVFKFFWFCLSLSILVKLKNSIFEMPIITQTLNINDMRITIANSINLDNIRKVVEYSLKNLSAKAMFTLPIFKALLF